MVELIFIRSYAPKCTTTSSSCIPNHDVYIYSIWLKQQKGKPTKYNLRTRTATGNKAPAPPARKNRSGSCQELQKKH